MPKSSAAANVIDLEAYRQRKVRAERQSEPTMPEAMAAAPPMVVPYFFAFFSAG